METRIKVHFVVLCVLALFSSALFAQDISLSFDICFCSLGLRVVNNSPFTFLPAFKRGGCCVFLISTDKGHLFPCKHWDFVPANSYSRGAVQSLPDKGEKEPKHIALTPVDLSSYMPSDPFLPRPTEFPRLFVQALIKHPKHGPDGIISSSIHEITVQNHQIFEVKKIPEETVPREVMMTFAKEIEKVQSEEKSPSYGIW